MLVGTEVGGKYRVDRVLAQGGMGTVLAATHLQLEQRVALKVLLPELIADPLAVERFLREGRAAAQLTSEHICRVLDVSVLDDGVPYLVMELLEGCDLEQLIAEHGPLREDLAATYVLQAAIGLAEAHLRGIIHRDLKPANLFLTQGADGEPRIKLLDFGIAKLTAVKQNLTATTSVIGSPHYMAPEQLRASREVDARSDLWSLGTILYELVSGEKAFPATSIMELSLTIAMDPPAPLSPHISPAFRDVVMRCLAKEPDDRFSDVVQFADALRDAVGPELTPLVHAVARIYFANRPADLTAQLRKITESESIALAPRRRRWFRHPDRGWWRRSGGWWWLGIATGGTVAVATALALLLPDGPRRPPPPPQTSAETASPSPGLRVEPLEEAPPKQPTAPPAPKTIPVPVEAAASASAGVAPSPPPAGGSAVGTSDIVDDRADRDADAAVRSRRSADRRRKRFDPPPPRSASQRDATAEAPAAPPVVAPLVPQPPPPPPTQDPPKASDVKLVDPFEHK